MSPGFPDHGFLDLGFAKLDHDRERRCGVPEAVLCDGKTPQEAAAAARALWEATGGFLATRAGAEHAAAVREAVPEAVHHERARCLSARREPQEPVGLVAVVCAGTADLPVAEEARVTLEFLGSRTVHVWDCGVAGIHRLHTHAGDLARARAVVVAAGMDGALPSVIGGTVACPVFAVPTSTGYGASFGGLAALLAMLNTCAPGVSVLNIDNGYGAACIAHRVNVLVEQGGRGEEAGGGV